MKFSNKETEQIIKAGNKEEFNNILNDIVEKKKSNKTYDRKAYDKEYNKKYYEEKKKEVKEITCEKCYGHYNYYSKAKHEKSARHLKALNLNKTI